MSSGVAGMRHLKVVSNPQIGLAEELRMGPRQYLSQFSRGAVTSCARVSSKKHCHFRPSFVALLCSSTPCPFSQPTPHSPGILIASQTWLDTRSTMELPLEPTDHPSVSVIRRPIQ